MNNPAAPVEVKPYRIAIQKLFDDPETLPLICDHVACGGTLIEWTAARGVGYSSMLRWIRAVPERAAAYATALEDRKEWARERVLKEISSIALVDISAAFTPAGALRPISDIPEDVRRAIASVEIDELWSGKGADREQVGETRKVKFWDKVAALRELGREMGMFARHDKLTITATLEDLVSEANTVEAEIVEPKQIEGGGGGNSDARAEGSLSESAP